MTDINNLTTDELCDYITTKVGIKLPTYDYDYRKYIASFPQNIKIGNCTTGILKADMYDSFRGACLGIIDWHNNI